ncbi:hypothetical protein [Synechocystis sp. FACHB-383]|nr:hypothetical protein [Synechocystis sp. FACHB-383]
MPSNIDPTESRALAGRTLLTISNHNMKLVIVTPITGSFSPMAIAPRI